MVARLKAFAALLLIAFPSGCGRQSASTVAPAADPNSHQWATSVAIHSYEWLVNGKNVGGGSQAEFSNQLRFRVVREANDVNWNMQIGSRSSTGSLHCDPSNVIKIILAPDGTLAINGPTSLLRVEERGLKGQLVKTTELLIQ